jgi:Flp pilus assembly pilin Flp
MKSRKGAGRATIVEYAMTALLFALALVAAIETLAPR